MIFRIVLLCLVLGIAVTGYKIWSVRQFHDSFAEPAATFTVKNEGNPDGFEIVEFMNYGCGSCKKTHLILMDYAQKNPHIRYVVRPLPVLPEESRRAAEMALAAGLQGKFWEMDQALSSFDGSYGEKFYNEVCALHEIDCKKLKADSTSSKVHHLAQDNITALGNAGVETTPAFMINKTLYQPKDTLTLPDLLRMVETQKTGN